SLHTAVLTKLAAICLRGAKMSRPLPWETVAVIGLGTVGHLAARVHAVSGARVIGVDTLPARADALRRAGIEAVVAAPDSIAKAVRAVLPNGADIVVDATGFDGAANQAALIARETGRDDTPEVPARYLVQGSYPESVAFPYIPAFHRELTVLFSRDTRPQDLRDVLDLLRRGKLNLQGVLGQPFAPTDAPQVYADLQARKGDLLTAAFQWSPE
ncbi:MAG: zinc-binding dehydrogenase, partial [Armatimonadetes bacterium]|nr:zinc-binding dehydrogenase [Armatimonadota bacterium]